MSGSSTTIDLYRCLFPLKKPVNFFLPHLTGDPRSDPWPFNRELGATIQIPQGILGCESDTEIGFFKWFVSNMYLCIKHVFVYQTNICVSSCINNWLLQFLLHRIRSKGPGKTQMYLKTVLLMENIISCSWGWWFMSRLIAIWKQIRPIFFKSWPCFGPKATFLGP